MTGLGVSNIRVSGGAGGVEVQYEDLAAMGRLTDGIAEDALGITVAGQKYLANPDLIASAVLDPVGAAKFEAAMGLALDGPGGLAATSAAIGLRGATFRAAAAVYQLTDELSTKTLDAARWMEGNALPVTVGIAGAMAADVYLHDDGDWERYLVNHPGAVDQLIGMAPGVLSAFGLPNTQAGLTALLAGAYPEEGAPNVIKMGLDSKQTELPHSFKDLLIALDHRDVTSTFDSTQGPLGPNIDVRKIISPDGKVSYIVDIPGTKEWNFPGHGKGGANDLGANFNAMDGNLTTLENGVRDALSLAGAGPHGPVMMVGHSQGGIVAARAANDFVTSGQYNVTHVVTAGSPIGRIPISDKVQVLSLENSGDIVPHLDASDNPATANRTTVTFDNQTGSIGGNHELKDNYVTAAGQLDSSTDPSVRAFRDSANNFLDGSRVQTYQYQVKH
ncbi:MAG: alpha/beta fold hydrolase [Pseudonocardiaceae bacterium]